MGKRILNDANLTADGEILVNWNSTNREVLPRGTLHVAGNFGSGSVEFAASYDGGTTFIPLRDAVRVVLAITSDEVLNFELASGGDYGDSSKQIILRLKLTGSTSPNLKFTIDAN